jgi:hypothetical protein
MTLGSASGNYAVGVERLNGFWGEYLTYVLWAITPEGRTANLGEILLNGTKSKLIPTLLTAGIVASVFGVWLGRVVWWTPKTHSVSLPLRRSFPTLTPKSFRGEPAIRQFD